MNGLKYFMLKRKKSPAEMAELTGLPEQQIREMMEEAEYTKPSHFYMSVSDALDLPVELLIEEYPDEENGYEGGNGVTREDWFERKPNTFCRFIWRGSPALMRSTASTVCSSMWTISTTRTTSIAVRSR